jgi:chromosome segregation ATPase
MDTKLKGIDFEAIAKMMMRMNDLEHRVKDVEVKQIQFTDRFENLKFSVTTMDESLKLTINNYQNKDSQLEKRIDDLESLVQSLIERPVMQQSSTGEIDTSIFFTRSEFAVFKQKYDAVEKRTLEHDERLTNNEYRLTKLEETISSPLDRIHALEIKVDNMAFQMNNKVNI